MPQQAWSKKRERQYSHIKQGLKAHGRSTDGCKRERDGQRGAFHRGVSHVRDDGQDDCDCDARGTDRADR